MTVIKASKIDDIEVIRTGLFIDKLLGGGIPKKRMVEIVGEPGMGKSTLCLQIVAEAQKAGQKCLWVDSEGTFTSQYARLLGVDMDALDVQHEEYAEAHLNAMIEFIEKETYDLIILDSIGTLTPRTEHEKEIGEAIIGGQAKPVSQFARKAAIKLQSKNVAIIAVNHQAIDIAKGKSVSRGGASWNYHKATSIHLSKRFNNGLLKKGEEIVGYVVVAQVKEKNKMVGNVGTKVEARYINNEGFSKSADLLQDAIDKGIFEKQGNTFFFAGEKLGMVSKVRELMKDENFAEKIKQALNV